MDCGQRDAELRSLLCCLLAVGEDDHHNDGLTHVDPIGPHLLSFLVQNLNTRHHLIWEVKVCGVDAVVLIAYVSCRRTICSVDHDLHRQGARNQGLWVIFPGQPL